MISENSKKFNLHILELDETHNLDFKESINTKKIGKTIAGMANSEGGYIYVGISDKKPRQIYHIDYVSSETIINNIVNNMVPRPLITLKSLSISNSEQEKQILLISIKKSEDLVQYRGVFYFRDFDSSHSRPLSYKEITEFHDKLSFIKERIAFWITNQFRTKHEFIYFYLIPPVLKDNILDFLYNREIEVYMKRQITNRSEIDGIKSEGFISWKNDKFNHPLVEIFKNYHIFDNLEQFTTFDFHKIYDARTNSEVIIRENGVIYGKIMFQANLGEVPNKTIDLNSILSNPEIYSSANEDDFFPNYPVGSLNRVLAIILHFFSSAPDYPWLSAKFSSFQATFVLNITNGKELTSDHIFEKLEYLGDETYFAVKHKLAINSIDLHLESLENNANFNQKLSKYVVQTIENFKIQFKPKILSYFGRKSVTYFESRRKNIETPLYDIRDLPPKYFNLLKSNINQFPLLNTIFPSNSTQISRDCFNLIDKKTFSDYSLSLYNLEVNKIPEQIQKWYSIKQETKENPIFIGFKVNYTCYDGWYFDEIIGQTSPVSPQYFMDYLNFILTSFIEFDIIKHKSGFEEKILKQIYSFRDKAIKFDCSGVFVKGKNGKKLIKIDDNQIIQKLFSFKKNANFNEKHIPYLLTNEMTELQFNSRFIERIKEEDPSFEWENLRNKLVQNHCSLKGLKSPNNYVLLIGDLGEKGHLVYWWQEPIFYDYRHFTFEFIFHLDLPENSIFRFES